MGLEVILFLAVISGLAMYWAKTSIDELVEDSRAHHALINNR